MTARPRRNPAATARFRLPHGFHRVTAAVRDARADAQLGCTLCFIAGAANAGGFLAIGQYTSHMTGIISAIADDLVLGATALVVAGVAAVIAFASGAATSAILINWGRRHAPERQYTVPLLLEAVLLMLFGLLGSLRSDLTFFVAVTAPLLCFIMGEQNAIITKISSSRIRTTHLTGMVTDIGIELGKLGYINGAIDPETGLPYPPVRADRDKLLLLLALVGFYFVGAVIGALGFKQFGFLMVVPIACIPLALAGLPLLLPASRPAA